MGLRTRKVEDFTTITKDTTVYGDNIVFIRGGSVAINDIWVHFSDITLDIKKAIEDYTKSSPRLFNARNSIIYILICMTEEGSVVLVPSISFLQTTSGDIRSFPDLSGKLPLLMVKLVQDGSFGLTGYNPITRDDMQLYEGYGNFTLKGDLGDTGAKGDTGILGITGDIGLTGHRGITGNTGVTGIDGVSVKGLTGPVGNDGEHIPWFTPDRVSFPIVDFIGTPTTGDIGLVATFTDLSTGNPTTWFWDFGDGTSSTSQNPVHTYNDPGSYDVYLRVENEAGHGELLKLQYITVSESSIIQDVADETIDTWQDTPDSDIDNVQDTAEV